MKRSSQVALVLMGVTATTAAGAYMMPPRPECRPPQASSTAALPQATPAAAQGEQPCRRRRWGGWHWGSGSYSSYSSNRSRPLSSSRTPTSVSTALSPGSRSGSTSSGPSGSRVGTTSTSRGGFGSSGRSSGS